MALPRGRKPQLCCPGYLPMTVAICMNEQGSWSLTGSSTHNPPLKPSSSVCEGSTFTVGVTRIPTRAFKKQSLTNGLQRPFSDKLYKNRGRLSKNRHCVRAQRDTVSHQSKGQHWDTGRAQTWFNSTRMGQNSKSGERTCDSEAGDRGPMTFPRCVWEAIG